MTDSITHARVQAPPEGLRAMMRGFPTGVAVITTTGAGGEPRGMTCSSVCSVTLDPPTLLVCLREGSPTLEAIRERGAFAVNLLQGRAQAVAELFASGKPDRFELVHWEAGTAGPHLTRDSHAIADCEVTRAEQVGDHVVVFGQPRQVTELDGPQPLLYGRRRYHSWPDA